MVKSVLMIAFHTPPMQGSSGVLRTMNFARHLPRHGWNALILSANTRAYVETGIDSDANAPLIERSFALDAARHLAVGGRYPTMLALPDRWASWWLSAVPAALRLVRRHRPQLVWSTYPIATAHLIGMSVHRITGIPWVADMRDPMTDAGYPAQRWPRKAFQWIEAHAAARCARLVCTTPGAVNMYRTRYPHVARERFCLIENGYDEAAFGSAPSRGTVRTRIRLVHSGLIYPSERDPSALLAALSLLKNGGAIDGASFHLVLRACGHDHYLRAHIDALGLRGLIELAPPLPYHQAIAEMQDADGLLLLQASNCNAQIPAKLYEYLRAGRPILALTDRFGDTAVKLRAFGIDTIAALDSTPDIVQAILRFLEMIRSHSAPVANPHAVRSESRRARSAQLATLFNHIVDPS
ncbi:MAG: glycosyltransferase [Pseudomonadota bacterium]